VAHPKNVHSCEVDRVTRPPLFTAAFVILLFVQFTYGTAFSTFFILPKYLIEQIGATASQVGNAHGVFALTGALAVPFVGALMDRIGRKAVLLAGILLGLVSFAPFGLVVDQPSLLALRAVHGLSFAMEFSAGGALAIDLAPSSRRAEAVGYFGSAMLSTNAFGPTLAEVYAASHSWVGVFVGCSLCCLVALGFAFRLRPPSFIKSAGALLAIPFTLPLSGAYVGALAVGVAVGTSKTFVPAAMVEEGAALVAPYFWGYVVGALLQRTAFGWLPDKLGRLRATILSLVVYGAALTLLAGVSLSWLIWSAPVLGFAHGAAYPATVALASDLSDPAFRGRVTALSTGFFNLGLGLASSGLAPFESLLGYRGLLVVGGGFVVVAGLVVPRLVRSHALAHVGAR